MMSTMRITLSLSLALLFLSVVQLGVARTVHDRVLDTNGKPVRAGSNYNIWPYHHGQRLGGGASTTPGLNNTCPFNVIQDDASSFDGIVLSITPVNGDKTVRLDSDVNIEFLLVDSCESSKVWKVSGVDQVHGRYVKLGGSAWNKTMPIGPETVNSMFKVEKEGDHYILVFCPTALGNYKGTCGNVGIYKENDHHNYLGLNDPALPIVFKRG